MTYPPRTVAKGFTKIVFNKRTCSLPSVCLIGLRNIWKEVLSWSKLIKIKHDQLSQTTYQRSPLQEDFKFSYKWELTPSRKNGCCTWGQVRSTQKSLLKLKSLAFYQIWSKGVTPINVQSQDGGHWWSAYNSFQIKFSILELIVI